MALAIADAGDGLFDSVVLLKSGSFLSAPKADSLAPATPLITAFKGLNYQIKGDTFSLSATLHFAHDAAETVYEEDIKLLHKIADLMQLHPQMRLRVTGHTDNAGTATYNLQLSLARAAFVVRRLSLYGSDKQRIDYTGKGANQPIATNETEEGRLQNRRVEFSFTNY
jgi:outer membrane protein OmpA-like peptidoglycan-associated protein